MELKKIALKIWLPGLAIISLGLIANTAVAALGSFPLTGANPHVASNVMRSAAEMKASTVLQADAASTPSSANPAYSVNVVTLSSGTVVREYVATASNTVFAVSWTGGLQPSYKDILGSYSERYLKPSGSDVIGVAGLSQRSLSAPDLMVRSFGHMGHFSGYAWLPAEVPAGVSLFQLQ
jgi:hypothetical protein